MAIRGYSRALTAGEDGSASVLWAVPARSALSPTLSGCHSTQRSAPSSLIRRDIDSRAHAGRLAVLFEHPVASFPASPKFLPHSASPSPVPPLNGNRGSFQLERAPATAICGIWARRRSGLGIGSPDRAAAARIGSGIGFGI